MIRLNFAESLGAFEQPEVEKPKSGRPPLLALAAVFLVLLGGAGAAWWFLLRTPAAVIVTIPAQGEPPQKVVVAPGKPTPAQQTPQRADQSGTQVPDLSGPEKRTAPAPVPRSVALAFQRDAALSGLRALGKATPDGVAFADLVLQSPGLFFIRGVADDSVALAIFGRQLAGATARVEPLTQKPLGAAKRAREFTVYGQLVATAATVERCSEAVADGEAVVKAVADAGRQVGLKLERPITGAIVDQGACSRESLRQEIKADWSSIEKLLAQLQRSQVPVGIERLSLRADDQDRPVAVLDLVRLVRKN
jgi:hypothetical protein